MNENDAVIKSGKPTAHYVMKDNHKKHSDAMIL
jgi:hypothetical protein